MRDTATRITNKQMDQVMNNKDSKESFYKSIKEFQEKEVEFLKKHNKIDHVKKIFSTLNFKPKPSSYTDSFGIQLYI